MTPAACRGVSDAMVYRSVLIALMKQRVRKTEGAQQTNLPATQGIALRQRSCATPSPNVPMKAMRGPHGLPVRHNAQR